jgi:hypothetical protein
MVKAIAASVVVLLLVVSSASGQLGNIGQAENWNHQLGSTAATSGNAGGAGVLQGIGALDGQTATSLYTTTTATQGVGTLAVQGGLAINDPGGDVTVGQTLGTRGLNSAGGTNAGEEVLGPGQVQSIGAYEGASSQFEGIGVDATQDLTKTGGGGTALALNGIAVGTGQTGASTSATLSQGTVLVGVQASGLTSAPGGTSSVSTTLTSQVLQYQQVNYPESPAVD